MAISDVPQNQRYAQQRSDQPAQTMSPADGRIHTHPMGNNDDRHPNHRSPTYSGDGPPGLGPGAGERAQTTSSHL